MKQIFDTIVVWLVVSSKDPEKFSLTIKAIGTAVITGLTLVLGFEHIYVGDLTPLIDSFIAVVQQLLLVVSVVATFIGLVRKTWRTYKGEHAGVNEYL